MSRAPLPLRDDERLIFALDVPDRAQALEWVERLGDSVAFYKIGMELLASGEYFQVLDELARRDKRVFVDLKFFDIPATAAAVIKRFLEAKVGFSLADHNCRGPANPSRRSTRPVRQTHRVI